jgi:RNAse (barnase) inhibitor barstar
VKRGAERSGFYFGKESIPLQERRVQARIPAGIETKKQLLDALDANLGFPEYFGGNWDALWDCICDLSWLEPVQVVLIHDDLPMSADRLSLRTYISLLQDAVAAWKEKPEHELVVVFPEEVEAAVRELLVA